MPATRQRSIRHLVIGNPANRRVKLFQAALDRFGLAPAIVIPYVELLQGNGALARQIEQGRGDQVFLRIESPGEDFAVERLMIARGAELVDARFGPTRISRHAALRLSPDHGRIWYPAQWLAGYCSLLGEIAATSAALPGLHLYNCTADIQVLFHKPDCYRRLQATAVRLPAALFEVESFDDLRERLRVLQWQRVFVKLASGSSASGVIALAIDGKRMRALTSMESVGSGSRRRFYNNLKLRVYHRCSEIRRAIDFLCRETAHVEQWLPKALQAGRNFDLRIVAIAGRPRHLVVRTSRSPLTNLHLGNRRGDTALLQQQMGPAKWQALLDAAALAARGFPQTLCLGLDVLLRPGMRKPTLLEANAFGDLLPGVSDQGRSTYEAQVEAMTGVPWPG